MIHHFRQLLEQSMPEPKKRVATKIPSYMKEERKSDKQMQSQKKRDRGNILDL